MPRILYPIWAQPVLTPTQRPEQVTESRWHQPLSEPVRWKGLIAAVVATTTVFGPSFVPNPVPPPPVDGWHGQISQPTLRKVNNQPAALVYGNFTPAEKDIRWFVPLSQPTLRKVDNQPAAFVSPNFTPKETDLRWFAPLSQPTLRKVDNQPAALVYANFTPASETITLDKWYASLSQPTLRRIDNQPSALTWSYFTPAAVNVQFSSSTTVVPYQQTILYQSIAYPVQVTTIETITVDKWYAALSLPTLRKPNLEYPAYFSQPFPITVENYRWWRPLAEPTRRELRTQPDALSWSTFTPTVAETVTLDKWYAALAQPTRRKADNQPAALNWSAFTPLPGTDDVRFSISTTVVPYAQTLLYPSIAQPVTLSAAGNATSLQTDFYNQFQQPNRVVWSPNGMVFTWLPPSGEPGPVTPTQGGGTCRHPRWPLYVTWHLKNCRWERAYDCPPDVAEEIDRDLPYEAPLAPEEIRRLVGTLSALSPVPLAPVEDDAETVALIIALDDDD